MLWQEMGRNSQEPWEMQSGQSLQFWQDYGSSSPCSLPVRLLDNYLSYLKKKKKTLFQISSETANTSKG